MKLLSWNVRGLNNPYALLGSAEDGYISSFCLGELVWEALVNYLEYDTRLSTVISLAGTK